MRITNFSKFDIECKMDSRCVCIRAGNEFECLDNFNVMMFAPTLKSYSNLETEKSLILKTLSFFDDPFKLIKEYHLTVESLYKKESICDLHQLNITMDIYYADADIRTYYEYVKVEANGVLIKPNDVMVQEKERILNDFISNNTKLAKWQTLWDIVIEPIILEGIGLYVLYRLFYIWLGANAWLIVIFLLLPTILFEILASIYKRKEYQKRVDKFLKYCNRDIIYDLCYK